MSSGLAALEQTRAEIVPALLAQFPGDLEALVNAKDPTPELKVNPEKIHQVAAWLKQRGFDGLLDLAGVDYLGCPGRSKADRFEVVYHFLSFRHLWRIRLRAPLPEGNPEIDSLADLWVNADPAEREVWDMFGVKFRKHPNLTRILNPDDWEGHPLRKDYPLRGPRALVPLLDADENRFFPIKADADDYPETPNER